MVCTKCGKDKSQDLFYWRVKNVSRYRHCKACMNTTNKKNYLRYKGTEEYKVGCRKRCKKYRQTVNFKNAIEKSRRKFPEKRDAGIKVMNALASGILIKPSRCDVCDVPCKSEAHHMDYALPLVIVWVCKPCHTAYHLR